MTELGAASGSGSGLLHCLGFDPGIDTGWAWLRVAQRSLISSGFAGSVFDRSSSFSVLAGSVDCRREISGVTAMVDVTRNIWLEVEVERGDLFLVCFEDFVLLRVGSDRALLSPVRLTAAYRDRMRNFQYPFMRSSASDSKTIVTDARLRNWNLYIPGPDHPRDAIRQAVMGARKWASEPNFREWVQQRQYRES